VRELTNPTEYFPDVEAERRKKRFKGKANAKAKLIP
jgi:hypothetical protein